MYVGAPPPYSLEPNIFRNTSPPSPPPILSFGFFFSNLPSFLAGSHVPSGEKHPPVGGAHLFIAYLQSEFCLLLLALLVPTPHSPTDSFLACTSRRSRHTTIPPYHPHWAFSRLCLAPHTPFFLSFPRVVLEGCQILLKALKPVILCCPRVHFPSPTSTTTCSGSSRPCSNRTANPAQNSLTAVQVAVLCRVSSRWQYRTVK